MIDGRTVMEIDQNCASAQEIIQLWEYLDERLTKTVSTMKFSLGNAQTVKRGFGSRGVERLR
jgi:hypothetical protein